jgi:hypothetical protein
MSAQQYVVAICDACLDGKGGYCNEPECCFCRMKAPEWAFRDLTISPDEWAKEVYFRAVPALRGETK